VAVGLLVYSGMDNIDYVYMVYIINDSYNSRLLLIASLSAWLAGRRIELE